MISTPMDVRAACFDMTTSAWTLAAVAALFESGLVDHLAEPRTLDDLAAKSKLSKSRIERCLSLVATSGIVVVDGDRWRLADGAIPFVQPPMRTALTGDLRSTLMQTLAFVDSVKGDATHGWHHTSRALLQAQGDASAAFPPMFKMMIAPQLGDLGARLEKPGARFLDVGVGVASLAITLCRVWPGVSVVGLDVFDVPLGIARENVATAGLSDRIELRKIAVQEFRDEAAFDAAWLPGVFIPAALQEGAVARVAAALKPGGWLLYPLTGEAGEPRERETMRLLVELWGGPQTSGAGAEALLKSAGLSSVRTIPGPAAWAPSLVVGQR